MSEASNTELIKTARAFERELSATGSHGAYPSSIIGQWMQCATALESLTATLTETEADLQASRVRENVSAGFTTRDVAYVIEELVKTGVSTESILAGALVGALDLASAAPSPTLEAVKAAAWDEGSDAAWDTAEWMNKSIRDYPRPSFHTNPYRPVSTEGESR